MDAKFMLFYCLFSTFFTQILKMNYDGRVIKERFHELIKCDSYTEKGEFQMFKSKSDGNKKGVTFNSFAKLISDSFFINKNITKLDFIGSTMISKSVLNGVIYVSNIQPSLSEMDDINSTLDRINLVDMIYLFTDDDSAEIYQNRYVNHTVTDSYVEINLKNGQIKRLNF